MDSLVGRNFGRWKVIGATTRTVTALNRKAWICQCDCPKQTKRLVAEVALLSNKSRSCGRCPDSQYRVWKPKVTA